MLMVTTRIQHHTPRDTPPIIGSFFYLHFRKSLPIRCKGQIKLRKNYPSFGKSTSRSSGSQPVTLRCKILGTQTFWGRFWTWTILSFPPPRWTCSIHKTGKGIRRVWETPAVLSFIHRKWIHLWQQSSLQSYWLHQSGIHNIHLKNSIKYYTCLIRSSKLSIFSIRFLSSFSSWDPINKEPGPCPGGITTWTRSPAEFSVGISEFGSMKGYAVPNQLGQFQAAYPPWNWKWMVGSDEFPFGMAYFQVLC